MQFLSETRLDVLNRGAEVAAFQTGSHGDRLPQPFPLDLGLAGIVVDGGDLIDPYVAVRRRCADRQGTQIGELGTWSAEEDADAGGASMLDDAGDDIATERGGHGLIHVGGSDAVERRALRIDLEHD